MRVRPDESAVAGPPRLLGYAFGSMTQAVTIFDVATLRPLETKPVGATLRWLTNDQHYWDGRSIWSYDQLGMEMLVEALAYDPASGMVARRIPTGLRGPSWGVELLPGGRRAWMAMAGDDALALLDLEAGEVVDQLAVGDYP